MTATNPQPPQSSTARTRAAARNGAYHWGRSGYDTFGYESPFFRQWVAAQLPDEPSTILSVGCGSGEVEAHLASRGHRVVGLDRAHAMLKRAQRHGLGRLVEADAGALPFGAGSFDGVLIIETLGYLEPSRVFAEARRVLKQRGRLLVTSYGARVDAEAHYRKWPLEEIARAAIAAGFRVAAQRALDVKKKSVRDAASEARANLLYVAATVRN